MITTELLDPKSIKSTDELMGYASETLLMQGMQLKTDSAQLTLDSTKASTDSTTLTLTSSYGLSFGVADTSSSSFEIAFDDTLTIGVTASLPLNTLFKDSDASITLENYQRDVEQAELNYYSNFSDIKNTIEQYQLLIGMYIDMAPLLENGYVVEQENEELSRQAYEEGLITYNDYLEAIDSLEDQRLSIIENKLNFTTQIYNLSCELNIEIDQLFPAEQ